MISSENDTLVSDLDKEQPAKENIRVVVLEAKPETTSKEESVPDSQVVELAAKNNGKSPAGDTKVQISATWSWLRDLFGHNDKFTQDWESKTLEACMIYSNTESLLKLPFGHQRLTYGLKKTLKSNRRLTWDQYLFLDSDSLEKLNRAVTSAKRLDSRDRTCIAIEFYRKLSEEGADRMLLFFSLGDPVLTVHLKDCIGRTFDIPFERCRTWDVSILCSNKSGKI
jgi:hypothetical protein